MDVSGQGMVWMVTRPYQVKPGLMLSLSPFKPSFGELLDGGFKNSCPMHVVICTPFPPSVRLHLFQLDSVEREKELWLSKKMCWWLGANHYYPEEAFRKKGSSQIKEEDGMEISTKGQPRDGCQWPRDSLNGHKTIPSQTGPMLSLSPIFWGSFGWRLQEFMPIPRGRYTFSPLFQLVQLDGAEREEDTVYLDWKWTCSFDSILIYITQINLLTEVIIKSIQAWLAI